MKVHLEKLSAVLMKARVNRGFSQSYMAHNLGISQKTYSHVESGQCKMDILRFLKIANILETHPMHIIENIISGNPVWKCIESNELLLCNEIEKLEAQISYLKSHNNFLKETVNKLIDNKER
jgi:DNA-binding XRE family transcriptional regulator